MKEINPNFFYAIDVDDANKFKSALWVDARCRASYEYYGDVVSFDTTYRRNRHGLPFASFVGVNHHGKSTLLSCALLGSEEIPSFEWVFTQWVRCIWQIMKKTQFKLGGYARYGELSAMMNHIVYNSPSSESFEVDWAAFIKEFALGQNRWLADLYANRRKWVPIFFKSEFWAGMRSTYRSESMHAFYGGYLHCKGGLVQFVHEYDNMLGNKEVDTVPSCYILPRCSKNFIRKHTYIKSSHDVARSNESHNLFRHLCSKFYNVAQEFVACEEKAAIL
ncbi:protein FAR1-RELATED SEQUENCE 6-like [Arachis hypogaea]|uniref:protein FAR1-RELATED SEQUENCE 6-like n=1 Tax=Arachis hypogaea TaxID=3818 RepID=UPI000DECBEE8|nr:protein FAR1-RELATED SEQUENCE 6-like [Arachis hypogaea]